jgi:hypothetical protein
MGFTVIRAGSEIQVNTTTSKSQDASSIAALPGGGWVVTWSSLDQDGSSDGIYQQRYNADGSPAGGETQVNTRVPNSQANPSVSALKNGGWIVTWQSYGLVNPDETSFSICQQRFAADGTPIGSETRVNTTTVGDQEEPSVTGLEDGGWIVAWQSLSSSVCDIYQQRYDANGQPKAAKLWSIRHLSLTNFAQVPRL